MNIKQNLQREIVELVYVTLYFGCWLGVLMILKYLILAEYNIQFYSFSMALIGALLLAKVVLVLEHVSLGAWVQAQPAWVDVVLRTMLYIFGVFVIMLSEKAFEVRHEYEDFISLLVGLLQHADINHIMVNTICLSGALLSYNILSVIRNHLGRGALFRMFLTPLPEEKKPK